MSKISVSLDNRLRLVSAVLATGSWPAREQAVRTHAVDPYAKLTRQFGQQWVDSRAVTLTNDILEQAVPINELFATAARCRWPDLTPTEPLPDSFAAAEWAASLAEFATASNIAADFWPKHAARWEEAVNDLNQIFNNNLLPDFLGELQGKRLSRNIVMVPNIVHPALDFVVADTAAAIYVLPTLPIAWGESPPWPYHEGEDWVLSGSCHSLINHLFADTLAEMGAEKGNLLKYAAATILIERALNEAEGLSYMVRSKKQYKLPTLPLAIETVRDYLIAPNGRSLIDLEL